LNDGLGPGGALGIGEAIAHERPDQPMHADQSTIVLDERISPQRADGRVKVHVIARDVRHLVRQHCRPPVSKLRGIASGPRKLNRS